MIDYKLLSEAIVYYESLGYQRIEAPWTVTPAISNITKPTWLDDPEKFVLKSGKELVASGEQSFLYLYNKGFLPKGRFQTITPCFRNDAFDETHTKYFMKLELIDTSEGINCQTVHRMMGHAFNFYKEIIMENLKGDFNLNSHVLDHSEDKRQIDIEFNDVEIGSYGIRECSFLKWVYGTGLAEPRFSRLVNGK